MVRNCIHYAKFLVNSLILLAVSGFVLAVGIAVFAADLATSERWDVKTENLSPHAIEIRRGETRYIEPTFLNYGSPLDLSAANTVVMNYKYPGMTGAVYAVTGSVLNATSGVVRVRWTSACAGTNKLYNWDMPISGSSGTIVRAYGTLRITDSVADNGDTNATPREYTTIDFATCNLLNVGLAPFLSSYDISSILNFNEACTSGVANLDINNLTVRGSLTGSAANLTNFPDILLQDILNGGTSGTTGQIIRTGNSQTIIFPVGGGGGGVSYLTNLLDCVISDPQSGDTLGYNGTNWYNKSSGESLSTNRLTWVVGGQTIGYVDTNGITMLKGSLQLFEEDLNCNVRAYDGSKTAPSVSFYASPLVGWYRKSYAGNYAWAFAHSSNDIFYLHSQGMTMAGSNKVTSYYFNTSGAYQFAGTNGGTTNITVITGILTNETGSVTGLVSQVLRFKGGLFCE